MTGSKQTQTEEQLRQQIQPLKNVGAKHNVNAREIKQLLEQIKQLDMTNGTEVECEHILQVLQVLPVNNNHVSMSLEQLQMVTQFVLAIQNGSFFKKTQLNQQLQPLLLKQQRNLEIDTEVHENKLIKEKIHSLNNN